MISAIITAISHKLLKTPLKTLISFKWIFLVFSKLNAYIYTNVSNKNVYFC